jgi:hypothetical protein
LTGQCASERKGYEIPNALSAVVEREKVVDYLLDRAHRYGASKAEFFVKYGFRLDQWDALKAAAVLALITLAKERIFGHLFDLSNLLSWRDF